MPEESQLTYSFLLLLAQLVKNPPAPQKMQEKWVRSLSWEHALEEAMATHSSIPAWSIPWTEEPGGLQSIGSRLKQLSAHNLTGGKQF